jgi:hypothetical protein
MQQRPQDEARRCAVALSLLLHATTTSARATRATHVKRANDARDASERTCAIGLMSTSGLSTTRPNLEILATALNAVSAATAQTRSKQRRCGQQTVQGGAWRCASSARSGVASEPSAHPHRQSQQQPRQVQSHVQTPLRTAIFSAPAALAAPGKRNAPRKGNDNHADTRNV